MGRYVPHSVAHLNLHEEACMTLLNPKSSTNRGGLFWVVFVYRLKDRVWIKRTYLHSTHTHTHTYIFIYTYMNRLCKKTIYVRRLTTSILKSKKWKPKWVSKQTQPICIRAPIHSPIYTLIYTYLMLLKLWKKNKNFSVSHQIYYTIVYTMPNIVWIFVNSKHTTNSRVNHHSSFEYKIHHIHVYKYHSSSIFYHKIWFRMLHSPYSDETRIYSNLK